MRVWMNCHLPQGGKHPEAVKSMRKRYAGKDRHATPSNKSKKSPTHLKRAEGMKKGAGNQQVVFHK